MLCNGVVKLIDWDKTVYAENPTKDTICLNDYTGSSTHTTPLIYLFYKDNCTRKFKQELQTKLAYSFRHRRIPSNSNHIYESTKIFILGDINQLIHCHIDLYAFSLIFYELDNTSILLEYYDILNEFDISEIPPRVRQYTNIIKLIIILQNTIQMDYINDSLSLIYYTGIDNKRSLISLDDLLKLTKDFYLIETNIDKYKQKYLKYKQKYLELKKMQ
jgi:hypothetical protein